MVTPQLSLDVHRRVHLKGLVRFEHGPAIPIIIWHSSLQPYMLGGVRFTSLADLVNHPGIQRAAIRAAEALRSNESSRRVDHLDGVGHVVPKDEDWI